jgi:adenylylsulfate kinase-like enzyme
LEGRLFAVAGKKVLRATRNELLWLKGIAVSGLTCLAGKEALYLEMTGEEVLLLEMLRVRRRFCMLEGGAVGWKECCGWK